jgi:predicted HD phosphohydrolase
LSRRSIETLATQGDALAGTDLAALATDPDREAMLDLRRADERAKDPRARVPGLESWRELVTQVAR